MHLFFQTTSEAVAFLPCEAGEGDRPKGGGGGARRPLFALIDAECAKAPTTTLRVVPLPRTAGEERDRVCRRASARAP